MSTPGHSTTIRSSLGSRKWVSATIRSHPSTSLKYLQSLLPTSTKSAYSRDSASTVVQQQSQSSSIRPMTPIL